MRLLLEAIVGRKMLTPVCTNCTAFYIFTLYNMKYTFRFYKTADGRWYIDLPEWSGSIDDSVGGGNYIMETHKGEQINHAMWLCQVTVEVFHGLPTTIYVGYTVEI